MAISVSFPFSWLAQPEARGPHSLLDAVFSTGSFLRLSDLQNSLNVLCTELYNSSMPSQNLPITGHRNMHFRRLWNGMFDRHRAEITVMQFTSASFVTVPRDFNPVPYCLPSFPTPMNIQLPRLWNGMFGRVGGQYTICVGYLTIKERAIRRNYVEKCFVQNVCFYWIEEVIIFSF